MNGSANDGDTRVRLDQTIQSVSAPLPNAVESDQVHLLVRQGGEEPGLRIEVNATPVTVGRTDAANIRVPDPRVSKKHCELRLVGDRVHVMDLGATNGTEVDSVRVLGSRIIPVGGRLRIGDTIFLHEVRSRRDLQKANEIESDLRKARDYVQALIPMPSADGPVRMDWSFIPCSILGGDAFGYHDLDAEHLALYLLDVCGHGTGAAMHSVSALNALRQQSLPGIDFHRPDDVLRGLNAAFDMDRHNGMYFTAWYGVYNRRTRTLVYATAGHPPALLVGPERRTAEPLQTRSMAVGMMPGHQFVTKEIVVEAGSALYIFSDGVFEIVTKTGEEWNLAGFQELVLQARVPGTSEPARLQQAVVALSQTKELADDFSLLVVEFN